MRECAYCNGTHFASRRYGGASYPVELPDGRTVHYMCLREWLIDDQLDRWFGYMDEVDRTVMRHRLQLDRIDPPSLPDLEESAGQARYSRPWASNLQRRVMQNFVARVEARRKADEEALSASQREKEDREVKQQLVERLRSSVDAVAAYLDPRNHSSPRSAGTVDRAQFTRARSNA